jgi:predicted small lipoprotein YifL
MTRSQDVRRLAALILGLAAVGGLSACGKMGPLERPAPLFGSRAKAEYEAEKAQEARDDAQRRAQAGGQQPQTPNENSRREVLDQNQRLAPASTAPMPGAPNPIGSPASVSPTR